MSTISMKIKKKTTKDKIFQLVKILKRSLGGSKMEKSQKKKCLTRANRNVVCYFACSIRKNAENWMRKETKTFSKLFLTLLWINIPDLGIQMYLTMNGKQLIISIWSFLNLGLHAEQTASTSGMNLPTTNAFYFNEYFYSESISCTEHWVLWSRPTASDTFRYWFLSAIMKCCLLSEAQITVSF